MKGKRRTDGCLNCGEIREMAAHGLCFRCYRQEERADDERFADVDRNNPGVRREHKKLFRGFTGVMTGLSDLAVQKSDVLTIRRMLDPYVIPIAEFLSPMAEQDEREADVNSEQASRQMFTVHTSSGGSDES